MERFRCGVSCEWRIGISHYKLALAHLLVDIDHIHDSCIDKKSSSTCVICISRGETQKQTGWDRFHGLNRSQPTTTLKPILLCAGVPEGLVRPTSPTSMWHHIRSKWTLVADAPFWILLVSSTELRLDVQQGVAREAWGFAAQNIHHP